MPRNWPTAAWQWPFRHLESESVTRSAQVTFEHALRCAGTGEVLAHGEVTCLCVDAERGRMVSAPDHLVARLTALSAEGA